MVRQWRLRAEARSMAGAYGATSADLSGTGEQLPLSANAPSATNADWYAGWERELLQLGREVQASYVGGFTRTLSDGTLRVLTNVEMMALLAASHDDRIIDAAVERWRQSFLLWLSRGCPYESEEYEYVESDDSGE